MKKIILALLLLSVSVGANNSEKFSILILNSYHQNSPWTSKVTDGLLSTLEGHFIKSEIYIENLDTKRFFDKEYINEYNNLFRLKFKDVKFDIIITSDNNALDYLLKNSIFDIKSIPKVFCGVNHFDPNLLKEYPKLYGVPEIINTRTNIELVKLFNPNLKEITFISDITVTGKAIKKDFQDVIRDYNYKINYIDSIKAADLLDTISHLNENDVIFYTVFNKDLSGEYFEAREFLMRIHKKTDAQIYAFNDFNFGGGIVGGEMIHGFEQGKSAAQIAIKLLKNKNSVIENYAVESPNKIMFDYRELKRLGKLNYNLPENSEIYFEPPPFIDEAVLKNLNIGLGIIIFALLIMIIKRNTNLKKMNKKLQLRYEENLAYNEQLLKFSSALDQSDNVIVITDLHANIEYANAKFAAVTGYSINEVIGKNTRILKAEGANRNKIQELWENLREGKTWHGEFKNKKKDGTIFWENATISPIKNSNGEIVNYIAIKEDVTKQKEREKRLDQLNRLLELKVKCNMALLLSDDEKQLCEEHCNIFIESGNYDLAFIHYMDNGKLIKSEPEYSQSNFDLDLTRITHRCMACGLCPISEVLDKGVTSYYHVRENAPNPDCILNQYNLRSVISVPITHHDQSFGIFTLYTQLPNRFDEEEIQAIYDISYMLSYGINTLREHKLKEEVEEELAVERKELSTTLASLNEGVITVNNTGTIVLSNSSAAKIISDKLSINGFNIFDILKVEDENIKKKFIYEMGRIFNNEIISFNINHMNIKSENETETKIISINGSSTNKEETNRKGIVLILRDITELTKIESQSALSQKMESIGSLASGIAHEINTPLQFVNDNTTFLNDSFASIIEIIETINDGNNHQKLLEKYDYDFLAEEVPMAISQSQEGLNRVSKIVKAMKDFAHTNNSQKVFGDLNQGIEVTATISRNEWKYFAELELSLGENLPKVYCSQEEINQVILNMIVNSSHAIEEKLGEDPEEKGKIKISTKADSGFFYIDITDNGIGIKKEKVTKIFDPFFTTKEVGKGTGQGLAIAHDIITNKHAGQIFVNSEYGVGTTITLKIPIEHYDEQD